MAKSPTISATAVPGQRISVGLNYPWAWNKYGNYFGNGESVPGDHPEYDIWLSNLDRNLGPIEDIISVVRIFLLCNLNILGTTKDGAGPFNPYTHNPTPPIKPWRNFVPPAAVSPIFADQLKRMLTIFSKHKMQVIPCLTDFAAFAQGPNASCRTDIITSLPMKNWFLSNIVDSFLDAAASVDGGKAVFAWDIMNEPGQVTDSLHFGFLNKSTYPIPRDVMRAFLTDVAARITAKGFKSTVGHHYAGDLDLPTGDFRQFHYYPQDTSWGKGLFVPSKLPPASETRAFVGEFQSDEKQLGQSNSTIWPEVASALQSGNGFSRTVARLQLLEAKGYGLALVWPDGGRSGINYDPATASLEPIHFSQPILDGIRWYVNP
jgi:hypothetical protein